MCPPPWLPAATKQKNSAFIKRVRASPDGLRARECLRNIPGGHAELDPGGGRLQAGPRPAADADC